MAIWRGLTIRLRSKMKFGAGRSGNFIVAAAIFPGGNVHLVGRFGFQLLQIGANVPRRWVPAAGGIIRRWRRIVRNLEFQARIDG